MNRKLLSICIPTFNRCEVLDSTLLNLFSNPDFDDGLIEVVVSDNCSTDNTLEIVKKYPLVIYHRNSVNIVDSNFTKVLSYGSGKYLKLFNDTLIFKKGALRKMLEIIDYSSSGNINLFFYNNTFLNKNCIVFVKGKEKFLQQVSFYTTWIANFGCWKQDFEDLIEKEKYFDMHFMQVDWSFQIVENSKQTEIHFEETFDVVTPHMKGGYNLFKIFVENYLQMVKNEKMNIMIYEIEKFRLLRYFVYPWMIALFVTDKDRYSFQTKGVYMILLRKFWYEPYLYLMLMFVWCKRFC